MTELTCTKCQQSKSIEDFHKRARAKNGLDSWCKACKSVYRHQYFIKHKTHEQIRSREKAWKYMGIDLSMSVYQLACATRDNKCDICESKVEVLHVDHNHSTGVIRGFLCGNCNKGIGLLQDNSSVVFKAYKYLEDCGD